MYNIILSTMIITLGLGVYNAKKHYKLYKDFNKKEMSILNPKEFKAKFTKKDKKRIKESKLGEDILCFKKRLEENINKDSLNNMYNNFKSIKTKEDLFILMLLSLGGAYNPEKNLITVNKIFKEDCIDHELLHCASTYYDKEKKFAYVGFAQLDYKNKKSIGKALNEGYTSLLVNRYFPYVDVIESDAYQIAQLFAKQTEKIVGQKNMEEAYFKADLNKLIKELEQYDTRKNIISVIKSLDFILKYLRTKKDLFIYYKTKKYVKKCLNISLKNIQCHLIKWYTKKLQNDLNNNLITKLEFEYKLIDYCYKTYEDEMLEKITKKKKIKTS